MMNENMLTVPFSKQSVLSECSLSQCSYKCMKYDTKYMTENVQALCIFFCSVIADTKYTHLKKNRLVTLRQVESSRAIF